MSSLRQECKQRLKIAFDSVRSTSESLSFLIVVDDYGFKILSNTIKTMQLIDYGISVVEKLDLKRKKIMKMQAVYLIHPDSIGNVMLDFDDEESPQYKYIHILSLSTFSQKDMQKMSQHEHFIKRLKTLKEINFNFSLFSNNEVNLCYMDSRSFEKSLNKNNQIIQSTIEQLSTIVTALPTFYIVQIYYQKSGVSNATQKIAQGLKEKLQNLFQYYQRMAVPNYNSSAPVTTFLILDRSFDPVSPLVRDFHYLPLLYDYYDIKNHRYQDQKKKKAFVLNQADDIIEKYKNSHISTALKGISADFQDFSKNNTAAKFSKNQQKELGMKDLGDVLKKMPQFVQLKDKYAFHYDALQNILDGMQKNQFKKQGFLQQSLLSLMNQEGKKLKQKDLLSDLISLLQKTTNSQEKAKLVLIGLMCLQLKPKDKQTLAQFLKKTPYIGIEKSISFISNPSFYRFNPKKDKGNQILDKHLPKLEQLMKQISSNQNYGDLKPLRVGAQKSTRPAQKHHSNIGLKKIKFDNDKKDRPKMIIFMNSALGYNEMRALSQFQNSYHLIYASHNFVTQTQYLKKISSLGKKQEEEQLQL